MFKVIALYKFSRIAPARVTVLKEEIIAFCSAREIRGLFLLSVEGCNATMAGAPPAMETFLQFLQAIPEFGSVTYKESDCDFQPFHRLKIDLRSEIVTLK